MADEIRRQGRPDFSIWSIGQGWEGTPADWTEYVVLLLGLISLIYWLHHNNQAVIGEPELVNEDDVCQENKVEVVENRKDR